MQLNALHSHHAIHSYGRM